MSSCRATNAKDRYAKLAGRFWRHPKVIGLTDSAGWLWTRALSYQPDQLTDGVVTRALLKTLGHRDTKAADELVEVGLWERSGDGYVFHDYEDHNLTSEKWTAHKDRKAKNQRDSRDAKRGDLTPHVTGDVAAPVTGDMDGDSLDAGRRTQDAGHLRDPIERDPEQVARERPADPDPLPPLVVLRRAFESRWLAKRLPNGMGLGTTWAGFGRHSELAMELAVRFEHDRHALERSLDGFFACADKFERESKWAFKTWANNPERYIATRTEPSANAIEIMSRIPRMEASS